MNIVHITAGAGGMYCGACLRDVELIRGLIAAGHSVTMVPLYTPMKTDLATPKDTTRIFYGGINVGLEQMWPTLGKLPEVVRRVLNGRRLLSAVSKLAVATRPEKLGAMTVSVLEGRHGRQRAELDKLLAYLAEHQRPDVVHLTNSLLSAIAEPVRRHLGARVVCSLQGEESFVEQLGDPHSTRAAELIRHHAASVDRFVASHSHYAQQMARWLDVSPERIHTVRPGIDHRRYPDEPALLPPAPTVGYLSRIAPEKGLDTLAHAFIQLVRRRDDLRLHVAGPAVDRSFEKSVQRELDQAGLAGRAEFRGELSFKDKVDFFRSLTVLALPSKLAESRGMAALEGLACGVPVVVPDSGIFPEAAGLTEAVVTVADVTPSGYAAAIDRLLADPDRLLDLRRQAMTATRTHFDAADMVGAIEAVYRELIDET